MAWVMLLDSEERQKGNLEHAHWRLEFLLSLLQTHRTVSIKTPDWARKESDYLHQIAEVQVELDRLESRARNCEGPGSLVR